MQRIVTKIFIGASLVFGVLGVLAVVVGSTRYKGEFAELLFRCIAITVFVVLSSFALSVAGKYLLDNEKDESSR